MRCSSPALSHLLWLAWPGSALPTRACFMPPMALDPMQGGVVQPAHVFRQSPQDVTSGVNTTIIELSPHLLILHWSLVTLCTWRRCRQVASRLCLNDESRWVDECGLASWTANWCPVAIGQGHQPPSMPEFACASIPCIPVTQLNTDLVAYIPISHIKRNCVNRRTGDAWT
ncbi:hypothetical protein B0H10DRAFT_1969785 [Mycena sp. CBHHK59/15]|nr:hypothetical protein B0H10DRAFT_1969785 [Mycena sp. CBHHK59/15]